MRRQWPCSKCGFACSSTWRSLHPSKPVICNTCRSKMSKNIIATDPPPKEVVNDGAKISFSGNSDFDQINPSSSIMHENNMAFTVSQIGMIFGNLPFEPTLAIPVIVHGPLQDQPKLKSKVGVAIDDQHCASIGFQDHFYCGNSLKTPASVLEGGNFIQIKQEYDYEDETLSSEAEKSQSVWDPTKVQKRRRSKLPQYTVSPLARFINQLHHVPQGYYRPNINKIILPTSASASASGSYNHQRTRLKYDDVLIYEKCKYVADNEIGLGAMLMSPPAVASLIKMEEFNNGSNMVIKEEPCSTSESDAYSNCLIDVPIASSTPSQ